MTYEEGGRTYEIDHLGIGLDSQWGEFAVYSDGDQVAEFAIEEAMLRREFRPSELPVGPAELIEMARIGRSASPEWCSAISVAPRDGETTR